MGGHAAMRRAVRTGTMNEIHSRLRDGLPDHAESTVEKDFAIDARSLRSWVDSLPLANFGAAGDEIVTALQAVDARKLSASRRYRILEVMREPAGQLTEMVGKLVGASAHPLPETAAAHALAALQAQQLLAVGYRRVLVAATSRSGKVGLLRRKLASSAATRALQHGALALRIGYMLYRAPQPGSWQCLTDLRAWLAMQRLLGRKLADPLLGTTVQADTVYIEALLMALANPYRFSQRERLEVASCLQALAAHARVTGPHAPAGEQDTPAVSSIIRIVVGEDAEPGRAMQRAVQDDAAAAPWLAVDLAPLLVFVEEVIASMPPEAEIISFRRRGAPTVHVEPQLVQRLLSEWIKLTERSNERHPGGYAVATAIGMHDMHHEFAGETSFAQFLAGFDQRQVTLSGDMGAHAWVGAARPRVSRSIATVLDQGLSGYRLSWPHGGVDGAVRARVGDVIAIGLPANGDDIDWMIGTIRWLRSSDDVTQAGVRLLARRALPVGMRTAGQAARGQELQRALLLLDLDEPALGYTALLAPPLADESLDGGPLQIELAMPADLTQWRSTPLIEHISVPAPSDGAQAGSNHTVLLIPPREAPALAPDAAPA